MAGIGWWCLVRKAERRPVLYRQAASRYEFDSSIESIEQKRMELDNIASMANYIKGFSVKLGLTE